MLRIALLIGSLSGGGAELQFRHLAMGLARRGHSVHVFFFQDLDQASEELQLAGIGIYPLKSGSGFVPSQVELVKALRDRQVQVLYAFLEAGCFRASLAKPFSRGPRVVWGIRNSGVDPNDYPTRVRLLERLLKVVSRSCDLAISNSFAGVSYAERLRINSEKIVAIPNGIREPSANGRESTRMSIRSEWGIPDDAFVFGLLARNDPMKGVPVLLDSIAKVIAKRPNTFLVTAGSGYDDAMRVSTALAQGAQSNVKVIGPVNPWNGFFEGIDALVSSSLYGEGFSNSIAEALLAGKPVVCTDVGDARFIVGEFGRVVPPGDSEALTSSLLAQIDEPDDDARRELRRSWITDRFSVEQMVSNTEGELLKLLASRRASH